MKRLKKEYIKPISLMLARAFKDEFKDLFPDPEERRIKEPIINEYLLRQGYAYNTSYITSEKFEGIAVWTHYDKWGKGNFWNTLTSGALWLGIRLGFRALRKMHKFDKYINKKHRELAPLKHWYLAVLAVDPEFQGRGFASRLLREMLARIDDEGLPCYVETDGKNNVAMYQHFGFSVLEEFSIPDTKDKLVAMLRQPQGSRESK